jgi:2',3'-cyclic-nucleotide 2'-phosphodiesterase (5'-nucleotidase family)
LKPEREAKERAVIVACHHPPASLDDTHGGSACLTSDLDEALEQSGLVPDAVLSGHAHLYERWQRTIGGRQVPYLIAGGGYGLGHVKSDLNYPVTWGAFEIKTAPISDYGYLLLTVDMTAAVPELAITFKRPASPAEGDQLTVTLD